MALVRLVTSLSTDGVDRESYVRSLTNLAPAAAPTGEGHGDRESPDVSLPRDKCNAPALCDALGGEMGPRTSKRNGVSRSIRVTVGSVPRPLQESDTCPQ